MALELNGTTGVSLVQDGVVTAADLADGAVTAAKINSAVALGITDADMRRLTTSISSNGDITSGFERPDDASYGEIGSGVTESSGIFSFPSTGFYLVIVAAEFEIAGNDNCVVLTRVSLDGGSNYDLVAEAGAGNPTSSVVGSGCSFCIVDVTDTSNVKLKFEAASLGAGSSLQGDTDYNRTHMTFIRLGDT